MGKKKVTKKNQKIKEKQEEKNKANESDVVPKCDNKDENDKQSKLEVLKKKIKRSMSNLSEKGENKTNANEMELEKGDNTIADNMISYELSGEKEELITVNIQKRKYVFNTS